MRAIIVATAALLAVGGPGRIQAQQATPPAAPPTAAARDSFNQTLATARDSLPEGKALPAADRFTWGDLEIPRGAVADGPVAATRGTIHVRGTVKGNAYAVGGDIIVHPEGEITGSATAVRGRVIVDGGRVRGEMHSMVGAAPAKAAAPALTGAAAIQHELKLVSGWFAVIVLVGLAVILFSGAQLETVVQAMGRRYTAAFWLGVAAQVGALPLLLLICVALVLTIIGILLLPFAIVAFVMGVAGVVTLGLVAAITVVGQVAVPPGANVRARAITSLFVGAAALGAPWAVAALLVNVAWVGALVHLMAFALTWAAITAGIGAALLARGGVRRVNFRTEPMPESNAGWQTPTPIGGVIAVRRPPAQPPAGTPQ